MKPKFDTIEGRSVLVTGGAGFIGSNLIDALLANGAARVVALDNFSTGRRENLASALRDPRFELIEADIRDLDACRKAASGIDLIYHEAALGSVPRSIADPVTTTEVNIAGFVNMLWAGVQAGVRRFVYASSSSVYGGSRELPKVEAKTGEPLSPYAITKCVNELYAGNFHALYGIDAVGLRYFNVFGPRQNPNGAYAAVIPNFMAALLAHRSPVINGDGSNSRDFTYVANVIEANLLAGTVENPEALNTAYNIAAGRATTLTDLFDLLKSELAKYDPAVAGIRPEFGPERAGDIPHSLFQKRRRCSATGRNSMPGPASRWRRNGTSRMPGRTPNEPPSGGGLRPAGGGKAFSAPPGARTPRNRPPDRFRAGTPCFLSGRSA